MVFSERCHRRTLVAKACKTTNRNFFVSVLLFLSLTGQIIDSKENGGSKMCNCALSREELLKSRGKKSLKHTSTLSRIHPPKVEMAAKRRRKPRRRVRVDDSLDAELLMIGLAFDSGWGREKGEKFTRRH